MSATTATAAPPTATVQSSMTILGFPPIVVILAIVLLVILGYLIYSRQAGNVEEATTSDVEAAHKDQMELEV